MTAIRSGERKSTTRHVLTVDLRDDPGVIEAYRAHHRAVWPEVLSSLRTAGIRELEIYALGRRLVMIVETEDPDLQRVFAAHGASSARAAQWEALMKALQEPPQDGDATQSWARMEPIFAMEPLDKRTAAVRGFAAGP
jgi:L-rhamnose mutarotase